MTGQRSVAIFALLGMVILMTASASAKPQTGFLNRTATIAGVTYKYQVYVPAEWNKRDVAGNPIPARRR